MALALEFVNVIIRKPAVEQLFPGGLDGFARQDLANLSEDDHLLRVGFMGPDADSFVSELEAVGLRCWRAMLMGEAIEADGRGHRTSGNKILDVSEDDSDVAVIWDGGPTPAWLTVGQIDGIWACWASAYPPGEVAWPEPGVLLRYSQLHEHSVLELLRSCEVERQEVVSEEEGDVTWRCRRGDAEILIHILGKLDGDSPAGLWVRRQLDRRREFHADVALIRDLTAILRQVGAQ